MNNLENFSKLSEQMQNQQKFLNQNQTNPMEMLNTMMKMFKK